MAGITKEEVFEANLEEEASVLEIYNELVRRISTEEPALLKIWLKKQLSTVAHAQRIGFYLDEFGARDVREIEADEAITLLESEQIWSMDNDTMLHVYLQGE